MRAIQKYLPGPRHSETMRIFVRATPEVAWQAVRHHNVSSIPWVNFLFRLRTIADIFKGDKPKFGDTHKGIIDEIAEHNEGFIILEENPGKNVVVGAIGKFWHLNIPFESITADQFRTFDIPGWGKVAWAISVEPYSTGSTISFDLRTTATDKASWARLNRYYHVIGLFSRLIRHSLMEQLQHDLGKLYLPDVTTSFVHGDEIIPDAKYTDTDKILIEAPASIVWSYLMQLGCDRAGWYSIDWIDNGGKMSTDHVVQEWKDRKSGDRFSATPAGDSFFEVYRIEHEKVFVIGGEIRKGPELFKSTWAFELHPIGDDACSLVVRAKMTMKPLWREWLAGNLFYPLVHGIMESVQLNTIRRFAERDANNRVAEAQNFAKSNLKAKSI
jgi:hypothetical protein